MRPSATSSLLSTSVVVAPSNLLLAAASLRGSTQFSVTLPALWPPYWRRRQQGAASWRPPWAAPSSLLSALVILTPRPSAIPTPSILVASLCCGMPAWQHGLLRHPSLLGSSQPSAIPTLILPALQHALLRPPQPCPRPCHRLHPVGAALCSVSPAQGPPRSRTGRGRRDGTCTRQREGTCTQPPPTASRSPAEG